MSTSTITFTGQNWLVTPAALAVNEAKPSQIADQLWHIVLTGVAVVDVVGTEPNIWNQVTITIPGPFTIADPLNYAISHWSVPLPAANTGGVLSLVSWAPFAAVSKVNNLGSSSNAFAVEAWRPTPFDTVTKDWQGNPISNLYTGIDVDVQAMGADVAVKAVSYHVTLLGKLAFIPGP
jgi:hypothetical protein